MQLIRLLFITILLFLSAPVFAYADSIEDARAAIDNQDFETAHSILTPFAENNNPEAQTILGLMHVNGQGVEKDVKKGMAWILKAANQGFVAARKSAVDLCMGLAQEGDTAAMYNVGYMCLNRWSGDQDSGECMEWLEKAAKAGHARSAKFLSYIYQKGEYGVTADETLSEYWKNYTPSAETPAE